MAQMAMTRSSKDARSDVELLHAIADRNRGALVELYARHEPWLSTRLNYRCADTRIVEEVVQDTFVAVWKSADRHTGAGTVAAWIWGIGYRQLLHALRPRRSLIERLLAQRPAASLSAEEELLVAVEHGDLGLALSNLSPELRAVVQTTVLDGLTCREAAHVLGIPSGTVKTRMLRARHELREALT